MARNFLQPLPGYVHRARLDTLLEKGLNYPLISVVAGPGYGKTTAVAGFARHTPMRLVWLPILETDRDNARFWEHFTEAVARELPQLAQQLRKTALTAVLGVYDATARLFLDELKEGPPILMVLDDFERSPSPNILEFVQVMLGAELPGLRIILISGEKLPLGGIVPRGGQLRVSMDDLSFTSDEIALLFQQHGLNLLPEEISQIAADTGSWPLALHLICVNQGGDGVDALREKTYRQLASELFDQHYFSGYNPEMRQLLTELATFQRFPLELVAKLAPTDTGPIVDQLSRNIFISYDYKAELFQFQVMYRAFLAHRHALLPDERKKQLNAFMGEWFLDHDYYFEALDCFWAVRDYNHYLATVFRLPKTRRGSAITTDILRNMEAFPGDFSQSEPYYQFCRAVLLLNSMQPDKARDLLQSLAENLTKQENRSEDTDALLGDCCVVLADISMLLCRDDGLSSMKKAVGLLPRGCRIRSPSLMLVGNNAAFYLPNNGPGQIQQMVAYYFEYSRYADLVCNGSGYGYEWLFAAQGAFLSEQMDKARENCFQAISKAKITAQHDIICNAYWELVRVELYRGDLIRAKQWLDELTGYIGAQNLEDLYELRDCATSWFYIRVGDYGKVAPWIAEAAPINTDRLLEIGRNRIVIIYYLSALGRLDEAYAEISLLEEMLRPHGRWHEKILLLTHKSIRLLEGGDKKEAIQVFKTAYDMVYQNKIAVIFAEFGKSMQKIIRAAKAQRDITFDPEWLEAVYKKAGSFEKRAAAMTKSYHYKDSTTSENSFNLNPKEKEILTYIAQGMTRNEIALHMNTSLSNVKRYINNIYTKLDALNRADAIHIATLHGLVDNPDK